MSVFAGFLKKELVQALRDPRMRVLLFALPVIQLTVFGVALRTETRNVRLAAIYQPNDTMTSDIIKASLASGWFVRAPVKGSDPFKWILTDEAEAVLIAPPGGLTKNFSRDNGRIQLLINASNVIRAQSIEAYMRQILGRVAGPAEARPFSVAVRVLFNPELVTAFFLVPAVLSMILCILTVILTGMSLAREKEMGTFETLVSAPLKTGEILLGKTVPFVLLGMLDVPLVLAVAIFGFQVPMRGSVLVLSLASFVFVCTTVSIGTLISTISRTQQQAMLGGFLFLMPAVLFAGIVFPIENMPLYMRWIAYLDPIQYFVSLLRNIMLKGGDFRVILYNCTALVVMAVLAVTLSFRRFERQTGG